MCVCACVRAGGRAGGRAGVRACVRVSVCVSTARKYSFQMALMLISTLNYAHFTGMLTIHMYYTVPVTYEALQLT